MTRKKKIRQLDLDLANHKGLLSQEEEQRYIALVEEGYDKPDEEEGEGEEEPLPLELVKLHKVLQLRVYDASPAVNSFSFGGQSLWLSPDERANYLLTVEAAKERGVETIPFMGLTLTPDQAIAVLKAVNLYAMQCVAVTEAHAAAIGAKRTIHTVDEYDFTTGYPDKLSF